MFIPIVMGQLYPFSETFNEMGLVQGTASPAQAPVVKKSQ